MYKNVTGHDGAGVKGGHIIAEIRFLYIYFMKRMSASAWRQGRREFSAHEKFLDRSPTQRRHFSLSSHHIHHCRRV